MIRTQISFDEVLYERAREVAHEKGISLAELCRRALLNILGEKKTNLPWMQYAGIYSSDNPRTSENIDEVVYGREEP